MMIEVKSCCGWGEEPEAVNAVGTRIMPHGMIAVVVDMGQTQNRTAAEKAVKAILDEFEQQPEISENVLLDYYEIAIDAVRQDTGKEPDDKVYITAMLVNQDKFGILQFGRNIVYRIHNGIINRLTNPIIQPDAPQIIVVPNRLEAEDALLLAADGFWVPLGEEEILIDYTKSAGPDKWLSYLKTRIGARLNEDSDSFAAVAWLVADER